MGEVTLYASVLASVFVWSWVWVKTDGGLDAIRNEAGLVLRIRVGEI